jgi:hypothetical protein
MKKQIFKILAKINKSILPSLTKKGVDIAKLTKFQKVLLGYRLWVTKNALN